MMAILSVAAAVNAPVTVHACAVCMGGPDSPEGGAMNAAIFLMLGCIGGVLAMLSAFAIYLYRRSQTPIPAHVQLAEMIGAQSK